jgi:hypothetical protein
VDGRSAHQLEVSRARLVKPKQTQVEGPPTATKIFVGGIPLQVSSTEFIKYFATFGPVKHFILPSDPADRSLNCGYGFVNFKKPEPVKRILGEGRHFLRAKEVGSEAGYPNREAQNLQGAQTQ